MLLFSPIEIVHLLLKLELDSITLVVYTGIAATVAQFPDADQFRWVAWFNVSLGVLSLFLHFVLFHGDSKWKKPELKSLRCNCCLMKKWKPKIMSLSFVTVAVSYMYPRLASTQVLPLACFLYVNLAPQQKTGVKFHALKNTLRGRAWVEATHCRRFSCSNSCPYGITRSA